MNHESVCTNNDPNAIPPVVYRLELLVVPIALGLLCWLLIIGVLKLAVAVIRWVMA